MSKDKFPILGIGTAPMIGRTKIINKIWDSLTKLTPGHLSLVGPRFVGKSVILDALFKRMCGNISPYCSVILWDLGHQTPRSDEEFIKQLTKRLGEGLSQAKPEYGDYLLQEEAGYSEVRDVMYSMDRNGQMVLMLWDGFDKPLSAGTLTRNLWDNLLDLCRKPSLRLVTSTRKELHQLIRDEKSVTSDFWGVFESVVRITPFDEDDIEAVLATLPEFQFQHGAKTELLNWSAGYPPFYLGILNHIMKELPAGIIDNDCVNSAASKAVETLSPLLSALWDDCPAQARDVYSLLVDRKELLFNEVGKEERSCLLEKGLARQSGNKLIKSCRMLEQYSIGSNPDAGSMARLFGAWADYNANIRGLLERRLAQISRFDERLHHYVDLAIRDIPQFPDICLSNLTQIEERALDLICQREFGATKAIPQEFIDYWASAAPGDKTAQRLREQTITSIPPDRWLQCGILQLLTGSKQDIDSRAQHVTKDTYVLINALHSFRNRNQHSEGQDMHVGVAVAAIMICLELLSCLERELV